MFSQYANCLIYSHDAEILWIEPWGPNALRIRATKQRTMPTENWALEILPPNYLPVISISPDSNAEAWIQNGNIKAIVSPFGKLTICNRSTGKVILEEYTRNRKDVQDPNCGALEIEAREFKALPGGNPNHHLTYRLQSLSRTEKLYGMGQYQQPFLNLKGCDLELAQRNSQASVPFLVSSLGYGFLWNNPGIGRAVLGGNVMSFEASSTKVLDFWVVVGDVNEDEGVSGIVEAYADVTGKVPMMPEYGLGFWQCKLRYQTQEELLSVAREYKSRNLPIDLIVVDFFHWPKQGEWKFDAEYWPDPQAMIKELQSLDIELMVSIWPTVDKLSENYSEMVQKGLLIHSNNSLRTASDFMGETVYFDATNPAARKYVWEKCKQNYYDMGVKTFWLDEAEPEYSVYNFDGWRYWLGPNLEVGNIYPREFARGFFEGMSEERQEGVVNLLRCAWAGSQRFGALVWSGDIASSWGSLRCQLAAGLNMGMAGIPWWTTDIGGFHGGNPDDPAFRELFVRWFQWGTFCPVMRLHGDRTPKQPQLGTTGGAECLSGAANEVWSYGEEIYGICQTFLAIREKLRDYTRSLMKEAHEKGTPVMRTLFYVFPKDKECWEVEDQYMFGGRYLICPILEPGTRKRVVYFPAGARWKAWFGGIEYNGGQSAEVECEIGEMPVFERL